MGKNTEVVKENNTGVEVNENGAEPVLDVAGENKDTGVKISDEIKPSDNIQENAATEVSGDQTDNVSDNNSAAIDEKSKEEIAKNKFMEHIGTRLHYSVASDIAETIWGIFQPKTAYVLNRLKKNSTFTAVLSGKQLDRLRHIISVIERREDDFVFSYRKMLTYNGSIDTSYVVQAYYLFQKFNKHLKFLIVPLQYELKLNKRAKKSVDTFNDILDSKIKDLIKHNKNELEDLLILIEDIEPLLKKLEKAVKYSVDLPKNLDLNLWNVFTKEKTEELESKENEIIDFILNKNYDAFVIDTIKSMEKSADKTDKAVVEAVKAIELTE